MAKKEEKPTMTLEMMKAEMMKATKGVKLEELANEIPGTWLESPALDLNRILSGDLYKSVMTKNHVGLVGPEACLDGDTIVDFIMYKDGVQSIKGGTIKDLFNLFKINEKNLFTVKSVDEHGKVFHNPIFDVVNPGKKECFEVITEMGNDIITTKDHKFLSLGNNYIPLSDLKPGSNIFVVGDNGHIHDNSNTIVMDTIIGINSVGIKETYDIKCFYPYNNYIANDIVVHNSGKSSFMCLMLADAQKKGYLPVIIDAEGAWNTEFVTRWGLDPANMLKLKTMWVEEVTLSLTEWTNAGYEKLAIALDSVGALDVIKMLEDSKKGDIKADQGQLQKKIKRMLKILVNLCKNHDCIAFSAGHYFGNPSGYGLPEQIGGGKYYRLSCDQIISLKKSPIYENPSGASKTAKGDIIGNQIKAVTLKNRTYPPFQEAIVNINYKEGVDSFAGIIELALSMEFIIQKGSWFTCDDLGIKAQGIDKLKKAIIDDGKMDELLEMINENLKKTGYSSVSHEVESAMQIVEDELKK